MTTKFDEFGSNLVFLVSLPRSGSTMLQRVLGAHPAIHTMPETWMMLHPIYALKRDGIIAEYEAPIARRALHQFLEGIGEGEDAYIAGLRTMAAGLYGKALEPSGKTVFLDKTPRYFYILPELHRLFPKAKIVLLLRNPLAVLASVLRTWFPDDLKAFEASYNCKDMMRGPQLLAEAKDALGAQAIPVSYEDLVTDPGPTVHALCESLDLPFVPDMLNYAESAIPNSEFGDQVGVAKHDRPVGDYLDTWIHELAAGPVHGLARSYLNALGPDLVARLGYSFEALSSGLHLGTAGDAIPQGPDSTLADLNHRGETLAAQGDIEAAMSLFRQGLEIDPEDAVTCNNLGVLHWQRGEAKEALHFLGKAYAADADRRETVLNLGVVLCSCGLADDARLVWQGYLAHHPRDAELQALLANLTGGRHQSDGTSVRAESEATARPGAPHVATADPKVSESASPADYLITAIVSTYNAERFLHGCLEDLERQTIADRLQIVVVDSGSGQDEASIVKEFQQRHANIDYIRSAQRETVYAAWNRGIRAASGTYITNANTDDRHREDAFERMVEALEGNPEIALVYGDAAVTVNENDAFDASEIIGHFRWPEFDPRLLFQVCFVGPQPMWRRTLHERYGLFDAGLSSAGDYEFWLRLCRSERFQHIPEVLGLYLYSTASLEHQDQVISAREAAMARQRHWPEEWGELPPARGNFFVSAENKRNRAAV